MRRGIGCGLALLLCTVAAAEERDTRLHFARNGEPLRSLDLEALRAGCTPRRIEVDDPYYARRKTFLACPLHEVLALGFGAALEADANVNVFLRARDGYTRPASQARLLEPGAHLAFRDLSNPFGGGWEPIDRRQVDPAPYYLVWTGDGQQDVHRYPWPYQLASIEIAPFENLYPHTLPRGAPPEDPAWQGFAIFRGQCVACHAINGEGGTVGPDLNVPRSIVEYRPAAQIKAYVRDPSSFRHTSMPSHTHLSDPELDALIAYFGAMRERKHDPGSPHAH